MLLKHGLLWSEQKEIFLYPLNDGSIVYDGKLYSEISVVNGGNADCFSFYVDNVEKKAKRQGNPYLYKDQEQKEYLIISNKVFVNSGIFSKVEPTPSMNRLTEDNTLIQGDNFHVLELLQETHFEKVDFICIDPPYNTGNNKMKYNDLFPVVNGDDEHSSWLSFMYKRLLLSKDLLSPSGLIIINIDENEYPYLKLLCDSIFGKNNFIETFIWEKNSTKNHSKTTSTNHEYILCYAKDKKMVEGRGYFRKGKDGIAKVKAIRDTILNDKSIKSPREAIESALKSFYALNPNLKGIKHYKRVDDDFRIYRISDVSAPSGHGTYYDVIHPVTGKVCKSPNGGYRYSKNTMESHLKNNLIHFGKDETTVPQFKRYLNDVETEVVKSVIRNTDEGSKDLEQLFNSVPFNNPKPISLIKTFLEMIPNDRMLCLDFFAGSGSTGHAVMDYNKKNGTHHRFILVTNNENNICDSVTYPRLQKAIEKFNYSEQLDYLKITYS